ENDWFGRPPMDGENQWDVLNPNTAAVMPEPVRIEGMSAYETWKQYHLVVTGAQEADLTKENYLLDMTGDSAFTFYRDYLKTAGDASLWPGFGSEYTQADVDSYAAFQRGDAYIPMWDEATGTLKFKFWDDKGEPTESVEHIDLMLKEGVPGLRVRGQVFYPTVNPENSEISFVRANEESTSATIPGVNIRGNVWVPSVSEVTGNISWVNNRGTDAVVPVAETYIRGEVYYPIITNERLYEADGTTIKEVTEVLNWDFARRPDDAIIPTNLNIKGIKGAGSKITLNYVNDVLNHNEFKMTITEPVFETIDANDLIGKNAQIINVETPFDRYNLKIRNAESDIAWYIGVDSEGRLITSNTPFAPAGRNNVYRSQQARKMIDMKDQITQLQRQIESLKK
ncbi:MAG: hypothetical protein ACRC6B_04990, partial [Fusobacteriaceae bacterium]